MQRAIRIVTLILVSILGALPLDRVPARAEEAPAPRLETLLRSELEGVDGREVIVSLVEVPPSTALATHYHPGEEFLYVLEGEGIIRQRGMPDVRLRAGDTFKVPYKQIHSAESGAEGIKVLVFRVHEMGQPERIPAE